MNNMIQKILLVALTCFLITTTLHAGSAIIKSGSVGQLKLGMSKEELLKKYPDNLSETYVIREGQVPALKYKFSDTSSVTLELDENNKVWALRIDDASITTCEGIGVGSTYQDVKEAYPDAQLYFGLEEGGYITLIEKSINGAFSFNVELSDRDWLANDKPNIKLLQNKKVELVLIDNIPRS